VQLRHYYDQSSPVILHQSIDRTWRRCINPDRRSDSAANQTFIGVQQLTPHTDCHCQNVYD